MANKFFSPNLHGVITSVVLQHHSVRASTIHDKHFLVQMFMFWIVCSSDARQQVKAEPYISTHRRHIFLLSHPPSFLAHQVGIQEPFTHIMQATFFMVCVAMIATPQVLLIASLLIKM
jgi:hypothetical protein